MKKIALSLLIIIISVGLSIISYATEEDTYKVNLIADREIVNTDETIEVILSLDEINIKSGEQGIGAYQCKIEYDKEVFEFVKMESAKGWDSPMENQGVVASVRSDGKTSSEKQEIAKIVLKTKNNAKAGETQIKVSSFEASNGLNNIKTEDVSVTINVNSTNTSNKENGQNKNFNIASVSNIIKIAGFIGLVFVIALSYIVFKKRKNSLKNDK